MVKLVTPTPEFYEALVNPYDEMPAYDAYAMRKVNRPWLMISIAPYTSIIVPNRSGAMLEGYANEYNVPTMGGGKHFNQAGYDIPKMILLKGPEHTLVEDWDNINPEETERSAILHKNVSEVIQKSQKFIKDFAKFSQQIENAQHVDDLPTTLFNTPAYDSFATAPLQFRQNELPENVTGLSHKLPEPIKFEGYSKPMKRDYSQLNKKGKPMTYITPLQNKTYDVCTSSNSPAQIQLIAYFQQSFSNGNDDFATPTQKLENLEKILDEQKTIDHQKRTNKSDISAKIMHQPKADDTFDLEL